MRKHFISAILCLVILLSAAPVAMASPSKAQEYNCFVTPATSTDESLIPSGGNGANSQNYDTYGTTVKSALAKEGDGFTLVTARTSRIDIEFYDESFCLLSEKSINLPLPIYGGVYLCDDYNFVVCAQNNREQNDSKEVYRIIRYSKNWDNPVSCSLYGANTTSAIVYGGLRFARCGNTLFVRTCHEMYRSSDGLCHQANLTMAVNISDMRISDSLYGISNIRHGYVSHSFNQFIQVDGSTIVAADHGDDRPRSLVISRYNSFSISGNSGYVEAFPIADNPTGSYNITGVSVGGFDYSDTHYLMVGNSCSQAGGIDQRNARRNIFVTATSKSDFSTYGTTTTFLTNYTDADTARVTTPHLVKINGSNFLLMWGDKYQSKIYMCLLNGQGTAISDVSTVNGNLSDCAPIFVDGDVFWVTNQEGCPTLYRLSVLHRYTLTQTQPDCGNPGHKVYSCSHCTKTFTIDIPAEGHDYSVTLDQPLCTEPGTASYLCSKCMHSYTETLEAREHVYGDASYVSPGCTDEGYSIYRCQNCSFEHKDDIVPPAGHNYRHSYVKPGCTEDGKTSYICDSCGDEKDIEPIPATGHNKILVAEYNGNCANKSSKTYYCYPCGQSFYEEGDYGDHEFSLIDYTVPDCENPGLEIYSCSCCGEEKRVETEATGHDYYVYSFVPAFCDMPGSRSKVCWDCGHKTLEVIPSPDHVFEDNVCINCGELGTRSELVSINYRRIKIVLNGKEIIPCDGAGNTVEPFIMNSTGTTYLPLRAIGQALGLNVGWDGNTNTVDLSSGGIVKTGAGPAGSSMGLRSAYITYRQIKLFLNGEALSLINRDGNKVEPFILNSNSSVYLPLRIIGEALGLNVSWDGSTSTVYLDSISE